MMNVEMMNVLVIPSLSAVLPVTDLDQQLLPH